LVTVKVAAKDDAAAVRTRIAMGRTFRVTIWLPDNSLQLT
jgi:hypothetical protein